MVLKIGINGFGRIGSTIFRAAQSRSDVQVVAINDPFLDLVSAEYLIKYDSIRGTFNGEVAVQGSELIVNGEAVKFHTFREPAAIPWKDAGAEYVLDASGMFTRAHQARAHIASGARRVVVCSPSTDIPMFVVGVNESNYNSEMEILSGASCTTNALSPLAKVMHENFTIEEALITTTHAYTASQRIVDGVSAKSLRDGRSAPQNIIPSTTSAAFAVAKVLPELAGRITGIAMIVPISSVSVVDVTCRTENKTTLEDVKTAIQEAANGRLKGILGYTEDEVVSSDMKANSHSCVFDAKASIALGEHFFKLIGWYDHQWAYSHRVLDLVAHVDEVDGRALGKS